MSRRLREPVRLVPVPAPSLDAMDARPSRRTEFGPFRIGSLARRRLCGVSLPATGFCLAIRSDLLLRHRARLRLGPLLLVLLCLLHLLLFSLHLLLHLLLLLHHLLLHLLLLFHHLLLLADHLLLLRARAALPLRTAPCWAYVATGNANATAVRSN